MFAYSPTPDRSAEILTNASNNAAQIQMQGMQSLGKSFAAMGDSFADSINKANENAAKAETNLGTAEALASIYKTYGTQDQYKDFMTGLDKVSNNHDKTSGFLAVNVQTANALIEMDKSKQIAAAQVEGFKDLADYKSANTPAAAPTQPKLDANYGRQFYQGLRQQGKMTHEQALAEMDKAGMNWAKPFIEGQKNPFFQ
jgi:hypothetical protein